MFEEKTLNALIWIIEIFKKENVSFRISGGFAAKVYGSDRELADIDIEIFEKDLKKIFNITKQYAVFPLAQYKDENWDLPLMTLEYQGQVIDICGGDNIKIFNKNTKEWEKFLFDINNSPIRNVQGVDVPIISLDDLIGYKSKSRREVDLIDIQNLEK